MLCCSHGWGRREWMWRGVLTRASAMVAGCSGARSDPAAAAAPQTAAAQLLREHVSIDVHTHAGPDGITSRTAPPSAARARSMRAGGIAVLCLADVPDAPILGRDANNVLRALRQPEPGFLYQYHQERLPWAGTRHPPPTGRRVREPEPGFLYQYHQERLEWLDTLTARHGIRRVLTVSDLEAAHRASAPAIILDIDGLDILMRKRATL